MRDEVLNKQVRGDVRLRGGATAQNVGFRGEQDAQTLSIDTVSSGDYFRLGSRSAFGYGASDGDTGGTVQIEVLQVFVLAEMVTLKLIVYGVWFIVSGEFKVQSSRFKSARPAASWASTARGRSTWTLRERTWGTRSSASTANRKRGVLSADCCTCWGRY